MNKLEIIGKIKETMKSRAISQTRLAEDFGVTCKTVSFWMKGEPITVKHLLDILEYLDLDIVVYDPTKYLLCNKEELYEPSDTEEIVRLKKKTYHS